MDGSIASTSALADVRFPSKWRRLAAVSAAACFWVATQVAASCPAPKTVSPAFDVASVTDGDTLRLANGDRVRIPGINTFELKDRGWRLDFAQSARTRLRALVSQPIRLSPWPAKTDRYGRLLTNVWLGDRFASESLVREGLALAVTIPPVQTLADCLRSHERMARTAKRGVWATTHLPQTMSELGAQAGGFQMLRGRVTSVFPFGGSLVILDDWLAVRWPDGMAPPREGSVWLIRGWLSRARGRTRDRAQWFIRAHDSRNLTRGF